MEKKILDRRSMLGRLGGAGLASAFVLAKGGSMASAQTPGEIVVMIKGMVAAGQYCGEHFIANIEFTPDADGMIEDGIFQIAEMSADLPYMEIGEEYPFVGTYQGRTFDLRVEIKDELEDVLRYVSFHGVTEYVTGTEPLDEDGNKVVEVAGSFSGPIGCELGSWTTTITDDSEWCDGCGCCGETAAKVTTAAPVVPVVPGATTTTTTTSEGTSTTTTTGEGTSTTTTTGEGTTSTTTTEEGTTTTTTTEEGTTTTTTTESPCPDGWFWDPDEGRCNFFCESSSSIVEGLEDCGCICDEGYVSIDGSPCVAAWSVCEDGETDELVGCQRVCVPAQPPCDANEVFMEAGSVCQELCDPTGCVELPAAGCFCAPNYKRIAGGCMPEDFCPDPGTGGGGT